MSVCCDIIIALEDIIITRLFLWRSDCWYGSTLSKWSHVQSFVSLSETKKTRKKKMTVVACRCCRPRQTLSTLGGVSSAELAVAPVECSATLNSLQRSGGGRVSILNQGAKI